MKNYTAFYISLQGIRKQYRFSVTAFTLDGAFTEAKAELKRDGIRYRNLAVIQN